MKWFVVRCVRVCMCCVVFFLFRFCFCVTAFSSLSEKVSLLLGQKLRMQVEQKGKTTECTGSSPFGSISFFVRRFELLHECFGRFSLLSVACNRTLHGMTDKLHAGHNHTKTPLLPTRNTKQANNKKTPTKFNYMPSSLLKRRKKNTNRHTHLNWKKKQRRNKAKQNETCNSSRLNLLSMWSDCRRA